MNVSTVSDAASSAAGVNCVIRRAGARDAPLLAYVSHACFPTTWPWDTPAWYRRRWWLHALCSPFAETFISEVGGTPAGFAILVTDEVGWNAERGSRWGSFSLRLLAATLRPRCGVRLIKKRLRVAYGRRSDRRHLSEPAETRVYADFSGVLPEFRRRGLGRLLLEYRESRSRALGRALVWALIESGNLASERLLESSQYRRVGTWVEKRWIGSAWEKRLRA